MLTTASHLRRRHVLRLPSLLLGPGLALPAWLTSSSAAAAATAPATAATRAPALAFPGTSVQYPVVNPATRLQFPRDFGAHPDYRIEWWYLTGWLQDSASDRPWGFQLTFFRLRTGYPDGNPSRFSPQHLVAAHAAVVDAGRGRHPQVHRLLNQGSPGVRISQQDTDCAIPGWQLSRSPDDHYQASVEEAAFGWALNLVPAQAQPWLQGDAGYSRKGPEPEQSSHYYSRTQLRAEGRLRVDDGRSSEALAVRGVAWLDHEWSSTLLDERASGWDWAGLNLHDGRSLVWFRIRYADGRGEALFSYFALREANGQSRTLAAPAVEVDERWRSATTGAVYPVALSLIASPSGGLPAALRLRPLIPNQELDSRSSTGNAYWEGAVRVLDEADREIGVGYLELTGYHRGIRL